MISQIAVAPELFSFVRTGPFSASVSFSIPEISASVEVSLFVANNSMSEIHEVQKFCLHLSTLWFILSKITTTLIFRASL